MRALSALKSQLIVPGVRPRQVRFGLYRGVSLELDLATQMQVYLGLQERETHGWIRLALSRCQWAIDVGAAQGELSILLLRHSTAAQIFACEPRGDERETLARNLVLNGFAGTPRLTVVPKFIGCGDTREFAAIDSFPIDRSRRGFIKIDVDGAEMDVLQSADRVLSDSIVDLLLETHSAELERQSMGFLSKKGYRCSVIDNGWWRVVVPEQRPIEHNRWLWATNETR